MAHPGQDVAREATRADRRTLSRPAARAVVAALRDPVVWVFLLAGIFEVLTGDPIAHGTLLFVVAAALAADAVARRLRGRMAATPATEPAETEPVPDLAIDLMPSRAMVTIGIALYAIAGSSFTRYTWPMTLVVGVPAIAAVAWSWRARQGESSSLPLDRLGTWLWIGLFVGLALWELRELLLQPSLTTGSDANPTISRLLDPILSVQSGRLVGLLVWLGLGRFLIGAASA
ncbi:MAG: hypothetical protein ACXVQV_05505 [Actinomycetota bacterium]